MNDLTTLPNIGRTVAEELQACGVTSAGELRRLGCVAVAERLSAAGFDVCRSKLSGLEGAIRGVRWHAIPGAEREALWRSFQDRLGGQ